MTTPGRGLDDISLAMVAVACGLGLGLAGLVLIIIGPAAWPGFTIMIVGACVTGTGIGAALLSTPPTRRHPRHGRAR